VYLNKNVGFREKRSHIIDDTKHSESNLKKTGFQEVGPMTSERYFEQTAASIASLGRDELKRQIRNFKGRFKLDFTDGYLDNLGVDRLRHILLAALINAKPND
jgi:hypothetical protein